MAKRILVIEDDSTILMLLEGFLIGLGYQVICSNNSSPLNDLDIITPDLIILDHYLGSSLGQILCKELKESDDFAHIPVILISASGELETIASACNADSYIKKPFDLDEVVYKVQSLLS